MKKWIKEHDIELITFADLKKINNVEEEKESLLDEIKEKFNDVIEDIKEEVEEVIEDIKEEINEIKDETDGIEGLIKEVID